MQADLFPRSSLYKSVQRCTDGLWRLPTSFSVNMVVDAKTGYLNYLTKVASSEIGFVCWVFKENGEKLLTFPEVTMSTYCIFFCGRSVIYLGRNDYSWYRWDLFTFRASLTRS